MILNCFDWGVGERIEDLAPVVATATFQPAGGSLRVNTGSRVIGQGKSRPRASANERDTLCPVTSGQDTVQLVQ